jgi:hypothetical protein
MHPQSHLRYHAERHADLLRQARNEELAARFGESRHKHSTNFLQRLWWRRFVGQVRPSNV